MAALQYVRVPSYAALIIRKDLPRLALPGGLIPRSHEWLTGSVATWNHARKQWSFPSGLGPPATITFGFLARPLDKFRYASSEYQFIAFDELTDFMEEDYLFLFSRLRKVKTLNVPLRMRSASNPGGVGHLWVKQRFISEEPLAENHAQNAADSAPDSCPPTPDAPSPSVFHKDGRVYIPSRIADNPALDADQYRQSLLHLPPVARERLMNGDWSVQESGQIKAKWLRYYVEQCDQLEVLSSDGSIVAVIREGHCRRFVTIDPAGTSADRARERRGRQPSWTVAQVWDQGLHELSRFMLLRHQVRSQVPFDGLMDIVRKLHAEWEPEKIWIEAEKLGQAIFDIYHTTLPIELLHTEIKDKVARSARLQDKLERGEVFLPKYENAWRPGLEAELLSWSGDDSEPNDQIDAAAYAAIVASRQQPTTIRLAAPVHRS
jgi:phage terminase large subunit-like protein